MPAPYQRGGATTNFCRDVVQGPELVGVAPSPGVRQLPKEVPDLIRRHAFDDWLLAAALCVAVYPCAARATTSESSSKPSPGPSRTGRRPPWRVNEGRSTTSCAKS